MPLTLDRFTELMDIDYPVDSPDKERINTGNTIIRKYFRNSSQLLETALSRNEIIYSVKLKDILSQGITEEETISINQSGWMILRDILVINPRKIQTKPLYNICLYQKWQIRISKDCSQVKLDIFTGENKKFHRIDNNTWGKYDSLVAFITETFRDN